MEKIAQITSNKWFRSFKYIFSGVLFISLTIGLITSYFIGIDVDSTAVKTVTYNGHFRQALIALGFVGIFVTLFTLGSKKPIVILVSFILTVLLIAMLLSFSSIELASLEFVFD